MTGDRSSFPEPEFRVVRRGYDRAQVDAHLAEVGAQIEDLRRRVAEAEATLRQLGFEEPRDLAVELEHVGRDVAAVLEAARQAAEELRRRATADAEAWRRRADDEAREARRAAWEEGSALLEAAVAEARRLLDGAQEEALLVRAEAEQEALRLVGDARREREETLRDARDEAERILSIARHEAESILSSARQQAEAAQERARALEQRRVELLEELEATRASIGALEEEIETRRGEIATGAIEGRTHWLEDEGAVRIVPSDRVIPLEPVDALEVAAEVEELRRGPEEATTGELPATRQETSPPAPPRAAAPPEPPPASPPPPPDAEVSPPMEARATPAAPTEAPSLPEGASPETPPSAEPAEPATDDAEALDELGSLFASLRGAVTAEPAEEPAAGRPAVPATPAPPVAEELAPAPEPIPVVASPSVDPFDLRDRLLLPMENRALRATKRALLDLQNRVLEALRTDPDWLPDRGLFAEAFGEELAVMVANAAAAGARAHAELTGDEAVPVSPALDDPTPGFVEAVARAVEAMVDTERQHGAGAREVGAAAGRMLRTWRTDEAERRVRIEAQRAYHLGLIAAAAAAGRPSVAVVTAGQPCPECPGTVGPWNPKDAPPDGTIVPPAGPTCLCTVVSSPAR